MPEKVAIVRVGHTTFRATSPGLSYKELMFEAATRAYEDAVVKDAERRKGDILDVRHFRPA